MNTSETILKSLTMPELRERAREMGIGAVTTYSKVQLVERILMRQDELREMRNQSQAAREPQPDPEDDPEGLEPEEPEDHDGTDPHGQDGRQVRKGIVENSDRHAFLRLERFRHSRKDLFIPGGMRNRHNLRTGDEVEGISGSSKRQKFAPLERITSINGHKPGAKELQNRPIFEKLTPIYPNERLRLETTPIKVTARIIDIIAPIGLGQRALIVSPPKAGKTIILKDIADSLAQNHPEITLLALLIDERPEEVTDFQRSIHGEVIASTFDERPESHTQVAELVIERAKRLAEMGENVVILLDSITRLARAYNLTVTSSGRTLSGGLDPASLFKPKRFFGSARNIEGGGSLTIIATALVDTGSKLDDIIYEEFKGTGNLEIHLDRNLANRRLFPAIDVLRSSTRHEELLYTEKELKRIWRLRRIVSSLDTIEALEVILTGVNGTSTNAEFLDSEDLARGSSSASFAY